METNQLFTDKDGELGDTGSRNCGDEVDSKIVVSKESSLDRRLSPRLINKPESKIFVDNSSEHSKCSKVVPENASLEGVISLDRTDVTKDMTISEESTAEKKFSPPDKDVKGGATPQRRCSPRLKNIPESERLCYGSPKKRLQYQQDEKAGDRKNNVDCNTINISNPSASSDICGNSDSKIDQNGHERRDVGMSNLVISATSVEGHCSENNLDKAGWLNRCNVTISGDQKGAHERVNETIRTFNIYYQQFLQEQQYEVKKVENKSQSNGNCVKRKRRDSFEDHVIASNRPDLKALAKMSETNAVMYPLKRFGHLPGMDVGYQFHSRAEMVALGFHSHLLHKIDCMETSYKKMVEYKDLIFPLAVAMVLSDEYEEDQDYSEDIIYTGETGSDRLGSKHQVTDQLMPCCNSALKNNLEQSIPIRVVRGQKADKSFHHKVYTYDGLYEVHECWIRKGISGVLVYQYRLKRLEGQPKLTKVQLTREHKVDIPSTLPWLLCTDISGGQEELCIPALNLVDDAPFPPTGFTYSKDIQVAENVDPPVNAEGCRCKGSCKNPRTCACAKLNGSKFPYVRHDGGRLLKAKDVVFECGPNCGCGPDCINRISQRPKRYHLEVFRTPDRGWAVRTRDFIPSGAPVCEYVGVLRRTADADKDADNDYVFEIDCLHTIKGVDGREKRLGNVPVSIRSDLEKIDDQVLQSTPEFCIDAGTTGNIARFINHSCEPNLFVQCVLNGHRDFRLARLVLFASENITPLQEITYDYGYALDSVVGPDGEIKVQPCYCGTADCRKRLY